MYTRFARFGSAPLPKPMMFPAFSSQTTTALRHVVNVYGRMTAWQLREESHDERPWSVASYRAKLPTSELRQFFKAKFRAPVQFPERLFAREPKEK
jgi:uncharacterized phage-associated protein